MDSARALTPSGPLPAQALRRAALDAGFDLCGFARAAPVPPDFFLSWLEAGMAADMDWMRERVAERLDVTRLVPDARTVVALACNYHRDDAEVEGSPIARYARGRDYHYTLQDRLRALRRAVRRMRPGVGTYASVDAGAVMEKVWAVRAGIGAVAKNGCLVTERFGSYVVLAALVLDVEVDRYDALDAPDRCGKCDLCLHACPTGALVSAGRVDAALCLSYQSIENTTDVPPALRGGFAGGVFGCDICQTVCPLNDAPVQAGERFAPRAAAKLDVRALAALSREEFAQVARGTPLMRAGYDGLRRNAAYALGAVRDRGAEPLLRRLAEDADAQVREAARWALERTKEAEP